MISEILSVSSHALYRQHHTHSLFDIILAICVASFALYKTSQPHFLSSNHHFEDIIPTILDIMSTVSGSSHQIYRWYHSHYVYDLTSSISVTSHPLYLWHNIHCVWHHSTLCSWRNTRDMYDILCTVEDNAPILSHQITVFMISRPLQAGQHSPCIRHRTHSIYAITLSPLTSHALL